MTLEALVFPQNASDKTVSYSSSDETVATVDGNGVVTAVSRGTATITAKTTDGGYTDTCDITVEQRVTGVSVSQTNSTLVLGDSDTSNDSVSLTATVSPSNANNQDITWKSSDPSVATVDESGVVTAQKAGTTIITTTTTDGGFYDTCSVKVEQRASGVMVSPDLHTLVLGDADTENDTVTLTAAVSPDDATDKTVSYSSSDETVATVNENGVVTAVSRGTATITAKTTDGGYTDACDITVKQSVTGVSVSSKTSLLILGDSDTTNDSVSLSAVVSPSNANEQSISWSSSNEDVAMVDDSGNVTAQKAGTAIITATTADGGFSDTCSVKVEQRASGVAVSPDLHTLVLGDTDTENDTVTLTAAVSPDDATDKTVSYSSSDKTVATVDENGVVTAISGGSAIITVTTNDGNHTAACNITVEQRVSCVSLSSSSVTLSAGETLTLTAAVSPSDATYQTIKWKSSDTSVATVSSSGSVTAVGKGTTTITASADGKYAECYVKVDAKDADGEDATPTATPDATPTQTGEDIPDTGDESPEATSTPETVIITIVLADLPEGTTAVKLPDGSIVELNGEDTKDIKVDAEQLSDDGSLELIALDDEGKTIDKYVVNKEAIDTSDTANSGNGIWTVLVWALIGIGLIAAALALYLMMRKH